MFIKSLTDYPFILLARHWLLFALLSYILPVTMLSYRNGSFGTSNNRITAQPRGDRASAYGQSVS